MSIVFLNGKFVAEKLATISPLDRGFLFGDGVYEVIPVYHRKLFELKQHLDRLAKSLNAIYVQNPYSFAEYRELFNKLIAYNNYDSQLIYIQITRGVSAKRTHNIIATKPTIYIRTDELIAKNKKILKSGFKAITAYDIRWQCCHIKSTSLLANVLYNVKTQEEGVEEVILHKNGLITEGASSNVFIVKNDIIYTPKMGNTVLAGVTRQMVINSAKTANIACYEKTISIKELFDADNVWLSSSSREIMPIVSIDNKAIPQANDIWNTIYDNFQLIKNA